MSISKARSLSSPSSVRDPRVPDDPIFDTPGGRMYLQRMGLEGPEYEARAEAAAKALEEENNRYEVAANMVTRSAELFLRLVDHVAGQSLHVVRDPNGPDSVCCLYCTGSEFVSSLGVAYASRQVVHQPDCLYKEALDWKNNGNPV